MGIGKDMKRLVARLSGNAVAMLTGELHGNNARVLDMLEEQFSTYFTTGDVLEIVELEEVDDVVWDYNIAFDLVPIYRYVINWESDERTRITHADTSWVTLVGTSCRFFPI